jgi:hypothetical protein
VLKLKLCHGIIISLLFNLPIVGHTEALYSENPQEVYLGPSVEDNEAIMDTDKNGFVDVDEVRAYLQKKHGADYQKVILDRWLIVAKSKSCGASFAKDLTK